MKHWKKRYGEWALITGASAGIGRAFAENLAESGLNLVLVARRTDRLQQIQQELQQKYSILVRTVTADLGKESSLEILYNQTKDLEIGILINNAGIGSLGNIGETDAEKLSLLVKLNCLTPTLLTQHYVQPMMERKKGAIIFLGSVVGYHASPHIATYAASKVFNIFMGNALWHELEPWNIDVLSLSPGGTATEFERVSSMSTGPWVATPEKVVEVAIKALGRKPAVVVGWHNKIWAFMARLLPVRWDIFLSGYTIKKFVHKD